MEYVPVGFSAAFNVFLPSVQGLIRAANISSVSPFRCQPQREIRLVA